MTDNDQVANINEHVTRYYGKYRGTVTNNIDPMMKGRIMAMVPAIGLAPSTWALPCLPIAGMQSGMFAVPPIGSTVWIEFEGGDPDHPIWTGGFWGTGAEVPTLSKLVPPVLFGITFQTTQMNGIVISDAPGPAGGIMLKSASGASIIVNDTGIYIQNGKGASIIMVGNTVDVNNGAMTIM